MSNSNDVMVGESGNDVLSGGNGDDTLFGAAGDDTLNGGTGQDTLDGGTGSDILSGGNGNDILDGNAGDDIVRGDNGNDIAIYTMSENEGDTDFYDGGNGTDRLRLLLTQSQLNSAAVQSDIQAYQAFLATKPKDSTFHFTAFDLTAKNFEQLEIVIVPDGGNQAPEITSGEAASEPENTAASTVVYQATAADADGDTITWSLSGADAGAFTIDSTTGAVTFIASPDYENPADADDDNNYQIIVDAFDGVAHTTKAVTITVSDVAGVTINGTANADTINATTTVAGQPLPTPEDDFIFGFDGNDNISGLGGDDMIDGGAGINDRAEYLDATGPIAVHLAAGIVTGAGIGSDTLRSIEIVGGSNFDDTFDATGFGFAPNLDPSNNNVGSNGTFNAFEGRGGNDTIIGNGQQTVASYFSATGAVTVDLAAGIAFGDSSVGTDTLTDVTRISGSSFGDTLVGNGASNIIQGRGGDDFIDGGANTGGGVGRGDRADYQNATGGINVQMADGIVTGDASVGTDTLRSMEGIIGSNFADVYDATGFSDESLNASSLFQFNQVEGRGGNDAITGNGFTELNFFSATGGVSVDLTTGIASGNISVGTDTFTGVNAAIGSAFDDTLTGDDNANFLSGRDGNDFITGGGGNDAIFGDSDNSAVFLHGNDVLAGGTGNDNLFGGGGDDTFVFRDGDNADAIRSFTGSFNAGAGTDDVIDLTGVSTVHTFADVQAIASDDGFGNTVIDFGNGDTLLLENVLAASLHADDFLLS